MSFQLGELLLPSNIFCAPLAGCSDVPFRRMTAKYRPGLMFCEMVKMDALVRNHPGTLRLLDYEPAMHPIGAQLCGSKPEFAGPCAKIIEDLGFPLVDLNCGCPVDKVTKDGSGSGLLKFPHLIGEIVSNMVAAVRIPVTVKIRAGWDVDQIVAAEVTQIVEQAGAKAICIHGRTRVQAYHGPANWDYIRAAKEAAGTIRVIGNGDVVDGPSAKKMMEETGCDGVLVARGAMGSPWVIEDIKRFLSGEPPLVRDGLLLRDTFLEHLEHIASYFPDEHKAVCDLRRIGCWFLRGGKGVRELRQMLNRLKSVAEIRNLILAYDWEGMDCLTPSPSPFESPSSSESEIRVRVRDPICS
jgi:nifR3 family TIM-barrel protein